MPRGTLVAGNVLAELEIRLTKFLLDDLENLLLIKFLGKTLDSGQSLTTIALCESNRVSMLISSCGVRRGAVQAFTSHRS